MNKYISNNFAIEILFFFIALPYVLINSIEAKEIRAVIDNPLNVQAVLMAENATYQGDYAFNDYIYSDLNSHKNLNDEFFRVREYQLTRWQQKSVIVVHKIRDQQGQNHQILFEKECDILSEAQQHVPWHFSSRCSFFRRGWEYCLNNMRIFVEEIEGLPPSVEIIASSEEEILKLFEKINITNVLIDSVPEWYCKSSDAIDKSFEIFK